MSETTNRTGHGAWCTVLHPHPGILWRADTGAIGFTAVGKIATDDGIQDYDGADLKTVIATMTEAGMDTAAVFGTLVRLHGRDLKTGDLDTWTPDRNRPRPDLGDLPPLSSTHEVMEQL